MTALLDTHVLIWWLNGGDRLSVAHREMIAQSNAEVALLMSDISLWEVATLKGLGRIGLTLPLRTWMLGLVTTVV